MIVMQSQIPYATYTGLASGNVYVADQFGIIPNVQSTADQTALAAAGCATIVPNPTNLLGRLIGANFNSTADQVIPSLNNAIKYRITKITATNASGSLSTAAGGLYTAAAKGGTAVVAAAQTYAGLTNPNLASDLNLAVPGDVWPAGTPLFLSLTTPQGAAATADIYVFGDALPNP